MSPGQAALGTGHGKPAAAARSPPDQGSSARTKPRGPGLVFRGQVLDPDGKPVAGDLALAVGPAAPAWLPGSVPGTAAIGNQVRGADGRFEVAIARETIDRLGDALPGLPVIAAIAPGVGPDWAAVTPQTAGAEISLRLRRDDVPIEGRVIDLEGRPVPGLAVSVVSIAEFPPKLLEKLRE